MLGRSTEWITSNSATASFALLDCSGPIRCNSTPGQARHQRRPFRLALPARGFRRTRAARASITGEMAVASNVFDTAISVTDARSRRASLHARAMSCSTWTRPFGKDLVSGVVISLASCPDFGRKFYGISSNFTKFGKGFLKPSLLPSVWGARMSGVTSTAIRVTKLKKLLGIRARLAMVAVMLVAPLMLSASRSWKTRAPGGIGAMASEEYANITHHSAESPARGNLLRRDDAEIRRLYPRLQRHRAQLRSPARQPAGQPARDPQHHAREQGRRGAIATLNVQVGLNIGDRDYFRKAQETRDFVFSDYCSARPTTGRS